MAKFRNKPIKVEAYQITEDLIKSIVLDGVKIPGLYLDQSRWHQEHRLVFNTKFSVTTIHGHRTPVALGDWIIAEPDGEHYYPCKPDIFEDRYEPVPDLVGTTQGSGK